jgi:hypothetical protein
MPDLNINPDIVYEVINSAREFHAKEGVVIPEDPEELDEEDFMQILADHKNDLTWLELKAAIEDLEPDQQVDLIALLYLGRGDFDVDEWDDAREAAEMRMSDHVAEYLISHPYLSDFLEDGLDSLGYPPHEE